MPHILLQIRYQYSPRSHWTRRNSSSPATPPGLETLLLDPLQLVDARFVVSELLELVLEAGGDDIKTEGDVYEIVTAPEASEDVRSTLEQKGLTLDVAEVTMMPQNTVPVEGKQAEQVLRLMEALDDQDDVRKAHANFDISDEVMAALAS